MIWLIGWSRLLRRRFRGWITFAISILTLTQASLNQSLPQSICKHHREQALIQLEQRNALPHRPPRDPFSRCPCPSQRTSPSDHRDDDGCRADDPDGDDMGSAD